MSTTPTTSPTPDADSQAQSGSQTARPRKRLGIAGFAIALVLGSLLTGIVSPLVSDGANAAVAQAEPDATSFVPISQYRTFDTRLRPDPGPEGNGVTKVELLEQLNVSAQSDLDGNVRLPDNAVGVSFNITVAQTENSGFVQISGVGTPFGSTSTINWSESGQQLANSGNVNLNGPTQEFYLFLDGADFAATHVIIDITGYYVPA